MFNRTNWRAIMVAFVGFLAASTVAFALNSTSSSTFTARKNTTQQTNYYRFTVKYSDPNISTGVKFGRLPANAFVSGIKCYVGTAFNGGGTQTLLVGSYAGAGDLISPSDLTETSTGWQNLTSSTGLGIGATSPGEIDLWARYRATGANASAGSATCVIEYEPDNDQ